MEKWQTLLANSMKLKETTQNFSNFCCVNSKSCKANCKFYASVTIRKRTKMCQCESITEQIVGTSSLRIISRNGRHLSSPPTEVIGGSWNTRSMSGSAVQKCATKSTLISSANTRKHFAKVWKDVGILISWSRIIFVTAFYYITRRALPIPFTYVWKEWLWDNYCRFYPGCESRVRS